MINRLNQDSKRLTHRKQFITRNARCLGLEPFCPVLMLLFYGNVWIISKAMFWHLWVKIAIISSLIILQGHSKVAPKTHIAKRTLLTRTLKRGLYNICFLGDCINWITEEKSTKDCKGCQVTTKRYPISSSQSNRPFCH